MNLKWISLLALMIFVGACSSTPKPAPSYEAPVEAIPQEKDVVENIDVGALQTYLRMNRAPEELGFAERPFNTCDVGYGYSKVHRCRQMYFVVLNTRLLCRESEGTTSEIQTEFHTTPLSGRTVRWNMKNTAGTFMTDGQGYGQINTISAVSQKRQRVRLALGNELLYMRSEDIKQVVTPAPWCNAY